MTTPVAKSSNLILPVTNYTGSGSVATPSSSPQEASRRSLGALEQLAQIGRRSGEEPIASQRRGFVAGSIENAHQEQIAATTVGFSDQVTVNLSNRKLTALPKCHGTLASVRDLDLSGNPLKEFPVDQLLEMPHLQNLRLSMEAGTGVPVRKSHESLSEQGLQAVFVRQGNASVKAVNMRASPNMALYTTDLNPCLALMVVQGDTALLMHVDSFSGRGSGRLSVDDVLSRHIKPNQPNTKIMLVGANAQGAASNVRGVLYVLRRFGLENSITMASLGNGHSSASLHIGQAEGYVAFG